MKLPPMQYFQDLRIRQAKTSLDLFDKSFPELYHTGYFSGKAVEAFKIIFASVSKCEDPIPVFLWPEAHVVLRSPSGEVCIWFNWQMMHSGRSIENYQIAMNDSREILKGKCISRNARAILEYECLSMRSGPKPIIQDEDQIKFLRSSPIEDPFKLYALEEIYDEILGSQATLSTEKLNRLKDEARKIFAQSDKEKLEML